MHNRYTRIGLVVLIGLFGATPLLLAEGQAEQQEGDAPVSMEEFSGTLTMWSGSVDPGEEALVEKFNEEHDDIQLEISVVPYRDYAKKVIAASRTGQLPDLLVLQPRQPASWGELGYLTPVTELVDELGGTGNFALQDIYFNTLNDEVWGVPFYSIPHVLFYRKDLLAEAGFDSAPATWDEFEEVAATLTEGDRYGYVGFLNDPSVGHLMHQWMAARGAETFGPDLRLTIDSEETHDTLRFLANLFEQGYMYEGSVSYGMGEARVFFMNDRAAMISTSTSFSRNFAEEPMLENIGVAEMPNKGGDGSYYAFKSLAISSEPQSLEAAEYVLEWINRPENYIVFFRDGKLGYIPTNQNIVDSGAYWDLPNIAPLRSIFEPAIAAAKEGWYPGMKHDVNQFVALFDAQNIYQDMLLKVIIDDWSVEDAATWAEEEMSKIMDRQ